MTEFDTLWRCLDEAHFELSEAFREFPDVDLWTRPDPRLLSVGELAAHIAFGEADSFLGRDFESPLISPSARYYPYSVAEQFELSISPQEVFAEITRIHELSKEAFTQLAPNIDDASPFREGWTWGYTLRYQAFHIAYHTGQIYSVRHLLGHQTPDN